MRRKPAIFRHRMPGFHPWFSQAVISIRVSELGIELWTHGGNMRRSIGWDALIRMIMPDMLGRLRDQQSEIEDR